MPAIGVRSKAIGHLLRDGLSAVRLGPAAHSVNRHVLDGVSQRGTLCGGRSVADALAEAGRVLIDSQKVYRDGDVLSLQVAVAGEQQLVPLATVLKAEPNAPALLANLIVAGVRSDESSQECVLPHNLTAALLADQSLWSTVPAISLLTRRPAFDRDFNLCKPGWNPGSGVLSLGPDIDTDVDLPAADAPGGPSARLPRHIRSLLEEFPWAEEADLVTAVAVLLTGVLVNHFIDKPHAPVLVEGNQRGVGKTLLVQTIGRVLDGVEPPRIPLTGDEELGKRLSAELLYGRSSIILCDNVRERIASELLEQNLLSPSVSFRILGRSRTVSRANTYLWITTSNQTMATEDIVDRFVIVRLRVEGDPRARSFERDPLDYAAEHRGEILGELAAMVQRWVQNGKPLSAHRHRCRYWSELIGGILVANGLGEWFLAGQTEAAAQLDEGVQALTALAEHVLNNSQFEYVLLPGEDDDVKGRAAADWAALFDRCQLYREILATKSPHARATWVGTFLGAKIGRRVTITHNRYVAATLRRRDGRSRQKLYYFELTCAGDVETPLPPPESAPTGLRNESPIDTSLSDGMWPVTPTDHSRASLVDCSPTVVQRQQTFGRSDSNDRGNDLDWGQPSDR